jgi:hypothetical protein
MLTPRAINRNKKTGRRDFHIIHHFKHFFVQLPHTADHARHGSSALVAVEESGTISPCSGDQ